MQQMTQLPALPDRPIDGHKGTFGRVLIVGGSDSMLGAPVLSGTAALRMGSGLVQIAVPRANLLHALAITPELIGLPLDDDADDELLHAAGKADAIAIGPGLGTSAIALRRLQRILALDAKVVVDADGLNLLAAQSAWQPAQSQLVLTPHPGEMKRLARLFGRHDVPGDRDGRIALALQAAEHFGHVVVLKGYETIIGSSDRYAINTTGNTSLAKAGTGDVLTGIIAALIGQGMPLFDAAVLGNHLHGRAGELAGEALGQRCVLARDVITALPAAIRAVEHASQ